MFEQTADNRNRAVGDRSFFAKELKPVGQALGPDVGHGNMNVDHLFKLDRVSIVALGIDAGPADVLPVDFADHTQIDASQQRVFGLFHISEEVGEVHDSGGVGIAKFNSSLGFEDLPSGPRGMFG